MPALIFTQVQSRCFTSTHFMELKSQLEKEHMVHISINNFTGQLVIAGIKGFDGMAVKVLQNFCKQFQACNNEFVIPGSLADRACSQWYISHLDRVKELIMWVHVYIHLSLCLSLHLSACLLTCPYLSVTK